MAKLERKPKSNFQLKNADLSKPSGFPSSFLKSQTSKASTSMSRGPNSSGVSSSSAVKPRYSSPTTPLSDDSLMKVKQEVNADSPLLGKSVSQDRLERLSSFYLPPVPIDDEQQATSNDEKPEDPRKKRTRDSDYINDSLVSSSPLKKFHTNMNDKDIKQEHNTPKLTIDNSLSNIVEEPEYHTKPLENPDIRSDEYTDDAQNMSLNQEMIPLEEYFKFNIPLSTPLEDEIVTIPEEERNTETDLAMKYANITFEEWEKYGDILAEKASSIIKKAINLRKYDLFEIFTFYVIYFLSLLTH